MIRLLLVAVAAAIQTHRVKSHRFPTDIFILAGQSNMAGRGGVGNSTWDGVVPPESDPNPSILRLSANLTWVPAKEPLHADIDFNKRNGVGPGMVFANAVLAGDPTLGVVGLVPCSIGGSNISQWAKGGLLYRQLVRRATEAVKGGAALRGMLWYQGETDTKVKEEAEAYREKLIKFFEDVRSDLNRPLMPIIQVGLASGEGPFIEEVREAQRGLNLPNVQFVDAKGLQLEPDQLHLSTPAQVLLGKLLAHQFLYFPYTLQDNNTLCSYDFFSAHHLILLASFYFLLFLLFFMKRGLFVGL